MWHFSPSKWILWILVLWQQRNYDLSCLPQQFPLLPFFTALPLTGTSLKFKTHCCRMARIKTAAPIISLCTTPTPVAPECWAWRLSMRCPATLHANVPFPVSPTNSHLSHSSFASLPSIKCCSATLPVGGGDSMWHFAAWRQQCVFNLTNSGCLSELVHLAYGEGCWEYRGSSLIRNTVKTLV